MELFNMHRAGNAPLITAHAGCEDTPPNSRESIVAAYHSAADIIEVDIRRSEDGVVFLMHDYAPMGTGIVDLSYERMSWHEIGERYGKQNEIFSFEAFCDFIEEIERDAGRERLGGKPFFNLDIKTLSALSSMNVLVRAGGLDSRVFFSGLDRRGIELAACHIPEFVYFFNADSMLRDRSSTSDENARIDSVCALARSSGCGGINLEWTTASPALVERIHENGLSVMLWTVDEEPALRRVLEYGADSITTHYPDRLAKLKSDLLFQPESPEGR